MALSIPHEAFWGLLGAFMYAGPTTARKIYAARAAKGEWRWECLDLLISLAVGTIAAAAFLPWVAEFFGGLNEDRLPGAAVIVGLLANPIRPGLIEELPKGILRFIQSKGPSA